VSQVETIVAELKTLSREERQTEQAFLRLGAVLAEGGAFITSAPSNH